MQGYSFLENNKVHCLMGGGQLINVSSISSKGVPDVMTCAWNTVYDYDQPLVVLAKEHTTTRNILDTGRYVIALPGIDALTKAYKVGSDHGCNTGDKFTFAGITPEHSSKFGIPVIPNALCYIECELLMRDLFEKTGILIGRAVSVTVKDGLFDQEQELFKPGSSKIIHYVGGQYVYADGEFRS